MFEPAIPAYARKQRDGDWRCPNPECMNHHACVFGTKMSCPVCGAPRPRTSFQDHGWGQEGAPPPPPPKAGMVRYGHVDNFTKLMRACEPKPYLQSMQEQTQAADCGEETGQSDGSARDWLCKCTAVNPRIRKRCGMCGAKMEEVQLEQSQMEWEDLCKLMQNARKGKEKRSRSRSRKKRKKRKKSSSSSSSSSSRRSRRKAKKHGSGGPVELSDAEEPEAERHEAKKSNPEIEQAKSEALKRIMSLKEAGLETQERNKQWRALLREWHPDKHENKELATAVFQFLQKAKSLIHPENK